MGRQPTEDEVDGVMTLLLPLSEVVMDSWGQSPYTIKWGGPFKTVEEMRKAAHAQCRRDVVECIEEIADAWDPAMGEAQAPIRDQLLALSTALWKARIALKKIPPGWPRRFLEGGPLDYDDLLREMNRLKESSEGLAKEMQVRRTGGRNRETVQQKYIAAQRAAGLLSGWCERRPTSYKDGEYFNLAACLFQIATGERDASCNRQCQEYLEYLKDDYIPDAPDPFAHFDFR